MKRYLIFICVLTSLIGPNIFSINLGFFQLSLFRIAIIFTSVIYFFDILISKNKIKLNKSFKEYYSLSFMLLWLFYASISILWVNNYLAWFKAVYFIALGTICIFIFNKYLKNNNDILIAFKLLSIMIIFHNIVAWVEINTGIYNFIAKDRTSFFLRSNNPVSSFGNTNNFATFMFFSVYILLVCFQNTKLIIIKLIHLIFIISSIILIFFTSSRANIFGLILSFIVFIYLSTYKIKTRFVLFIILFIIILSFSLLPDYFINIYHTINDNVQLSLVHEDTIRANLIKNGIYFFFFTFGFGAGAGNIEYWMENKNLFYTGSVLNIHNWWLEILCAYGLIIFIFYILFYLKILKDIYNNCIISSDKINSSISISIISIMTGFIISSISSSSNLTAEWLWVFWGLVISFQSLYYNKHHNLIN